MRIYPSRGDLVHICEGGYMHEPANPGFYLIPIVKGAIKVVLGTFEMEGERDAVWISNSDGRKFYVYASSWYPVEGPPIKETLDELQELE